MSSEQALEAVVEQAPVEVPQEQAGSVFDRIWPKAAVPEQMSEMWGVPVLVRGLSVGERLQAIENRLSGEEFSVRDIYQRALGQVLDPNTMRAAFSEEEIIRLLDGAEAAVVEAIVALANELSGLGPDDEDDSGKDS